MLNLFKNLYSYTLTYTKNGITYYAKFKNLHSYFLILTILIVLVSVHDLKTNIVTI